VVHRLTRLHSGLAIHYFASRLGVLDHSDVAAAGCFRRKG